MEDKCALFKQFPLTQVRNNLKRLLAVLSFEIFGSFEYQLTSGTSRKAGWTAAVAAIARDAAERIFSRLAKCEAEEVEDMDVGFLIRCLVEGKSKGFLGKGDCRFK